MLLVVPNIVHTHTVESVSGEYFKSNQLPWQLHGSCDAKLEAMDMYLDSYYKWK